MRIIVSFIQGSHTHIPETNHVPRGYIVTAILYLFMVPCFRAFIQGSHTHIPETNHVPRGYIVTAILYLLFMVLLLLLL